MNAVVLKRLLPMALSYMGSGGSLLFAAASQLVTFAILARTLGTSQFAIFVTISAFTNVGAQICGLGSQESLVRRVARELPFYPVMLGHSLLLHLGTGLLLVLGGMIAVPLMLNLSPTEVPSLTAIAMLLITNVMLVKIIGLATAVYIAHSNFAAANSIEIAFALIRVGAAVIACLLLGVHAVEDFAVWMFASHLALAIACLALTIRIGRPVFRFVRDEVPIGVLFSTQFIFKALRQNTDLLVLSMIASPEVVGSYGVARRILDSSYMSVEALNRLIYPGSARAMLGGLHLARARVLKVLVAAVGISVVAAASIFVLAPLMPLLFGVEYVSVVSFTRTLCWVVVPVAVTGVALEAFGAAGKQGVRAMIFNTANFVAAGITAFATLHAGVIGSFGSYYVVEIITAAIAWYVLTRHMQPGQAQFTAASAPVN